MKKLQKYFILFEKKDNGFTFKSEGFSTVEIIGILTVMRDEKIIECLNNKNKIHEKL